MKKRFVSITILVITIAAFFTACDLDARVGAMFDYVEGLQYFENASTEQDYEQAVSLFRKAAEAGHPGAQFMLGTCYVLGKGVEADNTQAVSWLKKVAEEVTIHQYDMGIISVIIAIIVIGFIFKVIQFIFKNILVPLCKAASKAIVWIHRRVVQVIKWILARVLLISKKAAKRGNAKAQFCLGQYYGATQDDVEAVLWYRKSAEQEYPKAQYSLGVCYATGRGIEQDNAHAVSWFRKAAEQRYARAQYKLGECYANGIGVKQDYNQALYWIRKAVEGGCAGASGLLKRLEAERNKNND